MPIPGELATRPDWLFSSGMLAIDTKAAWPIDYPKNINQVLTKSGTREHRIFTGSQEMPEPKCFWNLVSKPFSADATFHLTLGDYRDWEAIRAWADELASTLTCLDVDSADTALPAAWLIQL